MLRQAKLKHKMVSERAILSHEAERHLILIFTIKWDKYSVLATRQGLLLSLFGEIYEAGR